MKTTIEIPDSLFRRAKPSAASRGMTMRRLFIESMENSLRGRSRGGQRAGWRAVFGKAPAGAIRKIDGIIAAEFSRVDPEDWK